MAPTYNNEVAELEKERKKQLVIDSVQEHCTIDSPFGDLRAIAKALQDPKVQLDATVISGGATNYSYKVYAVVDGLPLLSTPPLFAKLSFPFAMWNPDQSQHYDVKRTENEFTAMQSFHQIVQDRNQRLGCTTTEVLSPVAIPYLCLTIQKEWRLLVTQWADAADEQFATQGMDGHLDGRVLKTLAEAFAAMNLTTVVDSENIHPDADTSIDPHFNDNVRPCFRSLYPQLVEIFEDLLCQPPGLDDSFVSLARQIGIEGFEDLLARLDQDYMKRETFVHADTHAFNILVEPRPTKSKETTTSRFGPNGTVIVCDWEMAMAGPVGQDPGKVMGWPLVCALSHAIQGHYQEAYGMLNSLEQFWEHYANVLVVEGGKDEEFVLRAYKSTLGWAGFFALIVIYLLNLHADLLPLDGIPESEVKLVMGKIGATGLRLMQYGFGENDESIDLIELKGLFRSTVVREIISLLDTAGDRVGSVSGAERLRASGRRISDASVMEEAAMSASRRRSSVLRSSAGRKPSVLRGLTSSITSSLHDSVSSGFSHRCSVSSVASAGERRRSLIYTSSLVGHGITEVVHEHNF